MSQIGSREISNGVSRMAEIRHSKASQLLCSSRILERLSFLTTRG